MRTSLSVVVVLTLTLLSGCLGSEDTIESIPGDDTDSLNSDLNQTVEPELNVTNAAPVVFLAASVMEGVAPLNVTFDVDATDKDGDNLTWTLDAGNGNVTNGTELPASVNATYLAGNWSAIFTVTDGINETMEQLNITVAAPAAPVDPNASKYPMTFTMNILLACPHCLSTDGTGDSACVAVITDDNGLDCAFWEIPADAAGRSFTADGTLLPAVDFYPDCSGSGRLGFGIGEGTIPEGAGCAVLWDIVDPVVTAVFVIQ